MFTRLKFLPQPTSFAEPAELKGCGRVNLIVGPNNSGKTTLLNMMQPDFPWKDLDEFTVDTVPDVNQLTGLTQAQFNERFPEGLGLKVLSGPGRKPHTVRYELLDKFSGCNHVEIKINNNFGQLHPKIYAYPATRRLRFNTGTDDRSATYQLSELSTEVRNIMDGDGEGPLTTLATTLAEYIPLFREHRLEIVERDKLRITTKDREKKFPLEKVGDGLLQIILFIAPIVLKSIVSPEESECLLVIDEPEMHLHPALWRKLLSFFYDFAIKQSNQIFIVTHSRDVVESAPTAAVIFETGQVSPFEPGGCTIRNASQDLKSAQVDIKIVGKSAKEKMLAHLLLGGNVLVVEGPSDQIVYSYLLENADAAPTVVVEAGGKDGVVGAVKQLRPLWPGRCVGIVDKDAESEAQGIDGVHVLTGGKLEDYLVRSHEKVANAYYSVTKEDGYGFKDEDGLKEELNQACSLFHDADLEL